MKLIDENGVPTVAGANAMFAAMDEARANREWRAAQDNGPPRLCCGEFETGSGQHGDECENNPEALDTDDAPEERGAPVDAAAAVAALAGVDPPSMYTPEHTALIADAAAQADGRAAPAERTPEVVKALREQADKVDALAKRKAGSGLQAAANRAAGRAEGLREAARMIESGTRPLDSPPEGE